MQFSDIATLVGGDLRHLEACGAGLEKECELVPAGEEGVLQNLSGRFLLGTVYGAVAPIWGWSAFTAALGSADPQPPATGTKSYNEPCPLRASTKEASFDTVQSVGCILR